ncbi:MAG: hypothetical protein ABI768_06815 [Acidobacteriota bacterium]
MTDNILHERGRAIEAQWARLRDEELIKKLRERAKLEEVSSALARKLRVDDPALRQRLIDLGVTHDTGPALFLAPLVQIAWADGDVTERERETILGMAAARGAGPGSPVHTQVVEWLKKQPATALYDSAVEVIKVGISVLPPEEREQRVDAYADSFRRVAEASGGGLGRVLGLASAISPEEEALIARITATLRG